MNMSVHAEREAISNINQSSRTMHGNSAPSILRGERGPLAFGAGSLWSRTVMAGVPICVLPHIRRDREANTGVISR